MANKKLNIKLFKPITRLSKNWYYVQTPLHIITRLSNNKIIQKLILFDILHNFNNNNNNNNNSKCWYLLLKPRFKLLHTIKY